MNLVGQGGKIIIFILPFVAAAIALQHFFPEWVSLPKDQPVLKYIGYVLFVPGILLWFTGLIQLLKDFPKGKLITTGAYAVCRNPVYSSFILFILPGISFTKLTWLYFMVALAMYFSVRIFIGKEESKLKETFGKEYEAYLGSVCRVLPFIRPNRKNINK